MADYMDAEYLLVLHWDRERIKHYSQLVLTRGFGRVIDFIWLSRVMKANDLVDIATYDLTGKYGYEMPPKCKKDRTK